MRVKLTESQIKHLWGMLLDNTERNIAHQISDTTGGKVSADDILNNGDIGIFMARAIRKLQLEGYDKEYTFEQVCGYVYRAGENRGRTYLAEKIERSKQEVEIDRISPSEVSYLVTDNGETDAEEVLLRKEKQKEDRQRIKDLCGQHGLAYKDGITIEELKEQIAVKSRKGYLVTDTTTTVYRVSEALQAGCNTKKQVVEYFHKNNYPVFCIESIAVAISQIRGRAGIVKEQKLASHKAADILTKNPNLTFQEYCDKMGDVCKYRTKRTYYQDFKNGKLQRKRVVNSRAQAEKIITKNPNIKFDEFFKQLPNITKATARTYYQDIKNLYYKHKEGLVTHLKAKGKGTDRRA